MKVAVIGTVGVPANYGGFETLVENLVTRRQREDIEYVVYCSSRAYDSRMKNYKGARLKYVPLKANGWQSPLYDAVSLVRAWFSEDVILSLGGANVLHPLLRLLGRRTVINNFDGMDCTREKWSGLAKRVLLFTTRVTARWADVCIADNVVIRRHMKETYGRGAELIEYGGDNAEAVPDDGTLEREWGLRPGEYCFKVARIEPENNIEMILEAFARMPERKLVVVGNWSRSAFGTGMRAKYGGMDNITLLDPIFDPRRLNMLRSNCDLYIHGHSAGGTNPSLVEAMSLGLAVVAYGVSYNRATTEDKALYFDSVESLVETVSAPPRDPEAVRRDMREIAGRRYRWNVICSKYEALYDRRPR